MYFKFCIFKFILRKPNKIVVLKFIKFIRHFCSSGKNNIFLFKRTKKQKTFNFN